MGHHSSIEKIYLQDSWVSIGVFDGVHIGHQAIIEKLVKGAHAKNRKSVVITFFPHPAKVLGKINGSLYLTSSEERATLLLGLGVDEVITFPFDLAISRLSALEFVDKLYKHLKMEKLIVGYDFAFGKDREGNIDKLRVLGKNFHFDVENIPPVILDGDVVSSSRVREALREGNVTLASRLLGRSYRLEGIVVVGDGRGRTIGIPTANLEVWKERILPKNGVYYCKVHLVSGVYAGVTNIGSRPTFDEGNDNQTVETHILDFADDLYGKKIKLDFIQRFRDEKKFPNAEKLISQIKLDIERARLIFRESG